MIQYILKTLQTENHVFIERLGSFQLNLCHAKIEGETIQPPHYEVVFEHTDSEENNFALSNLISREQQCLFTQANEQVTAWVGELLTALQNNKSVTYEDFGTFMLDKKGNITFESAVIPQLNTLFEGMDPVDVKRLGVGIEPVVEPEPGVEDEEDEKDEKEEKEEVSVEETVGANDDSPEEDEKDEKEEEDEKDEEDEEDEKEEVSVEETVGANDNSPTETMNVVEPVVELEPVAEPEPEPVVEEEEDEEDEKEEVSVEEPVGENDDSPEEEEDEEDEKDEEDEEDEEEDDDDDDDDDHKKHHGLAWLWIILLLLVVLGVLGYIFKDKLLDYYHQWQEKKQPVEQVVEPQETPEATATVDEITEPEPVGADNDSPEETVSEPEPVTYTPTAIKQSSDGKYDYIRFEKGHYYVIAGSFPNENDVIRHIRQKKLDQYSPKILKQDGVSNLRVCIGIFDTESEAESFAKGVNSSYWVLK